MEASVIFFVAECAADPALVEKATKILKLHNSKTHWLSDCFVS
jgi:hypothetical protein